MIDVLAGLDPEQRRAAALPPGPVVVLAGAGTGKTRTITHRIAHLVHTGAVQPEHVLAVTFTTKAAGELRSRLRALDVGGSDGGGPGVQARTFHAAARRQLAYFWPRAIGGQLPPVAESKIRLVAEAASRLRLGLSRSDLRDVAGEIEWARATLTPAADYPARAAAAHREPPRPAEEIGRLLGAYDEVKQRAGVVDFDDLLLLLAGILGDHSDIAEEVRRQYRHLVVDEYQDVTPLQQQVLDAWLGGRDSLTVVGDAHQTIYSFTGATPSYLLGMTRRYPGAEVVRLTRDYRSTPQVVALANGVIGRARDVPAGARLALAGQRPDGPAPSFVAVDSEPAEARRLVADVKGLAGRGVPLAEMAVLYRIHAQSEVYEAAFADAGIPVVLRGGARFFDRPEVREAVVLLRGAAKGAEPPPGETLGEQVAEVLSAARWHPDAPPAGGGAARERWDNLAAVAALAEGHRDLGSFLGDLEERAATQHAPAVQGVTLATLHAAKGLEWDAVWLVGLVEGTLPLVHAQTAAQVEEERRLLYVGVTRAREHLSLSWSAARAEGGRRSRRRSRFLDGLVPESVEAAESAAEPGARKARTLARCGGCGRPLATAAERILGHCADCPPAGDGEALAGLFTRLREWRAATAKELGQPAFCVFTDATLTAIAERRPGSRVELAGIPGVGATKLDRYGDVVIGLVGQQQPTSSRAGA